jgi:H+-transporting ATPase
VIRDARTDEHRRADEKLAADQGLSGAEAAARLRDYGPNALQEEERSVLLELLSHFWAPIPWMIEAALLLTAVTGRWADFAIITALLGLNGLVGFWEEHQAANAIAALKERLARRARVSRDGEWRVVAAEELVPGDLIAVERGSVVPADGQVAAGGAEVDESVLTGESLPVAKGAGDDIYSGTVVSRGTPSVRVLATGGATEFGRTAELTAERGPSSHFQTAIFAIGRYLIAIAVALIGVIVAVSLLRGDDVATTLEFALVVTIASIPVALPAVLSVTMAVGSRHLARHEAVVSHLPAVEEMSGVDVLCADKTGTITKNELAIADIAAVGGGVGREEVLREAALTAERDGGDPIDAAVTAALGRFPDDCEVLDFEPFDADRKRAEARVREPGGDEYRVAKGAVQAVLDLAGADARRRPSSRAGGSGRWPSPAPTTAPGGCAGCWRSPTRRAKTRGKR